AARPKQRKGMIMRITIASLLVSQLAFAQAPAPAPAPAAAAPVEAPPTAAPPAAAPPAAAAPTAEAPKADAPGAASGTPAPAAEGSAPVAGLQQKDPYRVVNPIAFYAVAGVSVAFLIFAVAMDGVAASTRGHIATMGSAQDVLNAQNTAIAQTNAATVSYVVG